jgi:hypothetical protein
VEEVSGLLKRYYVSLDSLAGQAPPHAVDVCVYTPWWQNVAMVTGALASLATLWSVLHYAGKRK